MRGIHVFLFFVAQGAEKQKHVDGRDERDHDDRGMIW